MPEAMAGHAEGRVLRPLTFAHVAFPHLVAVVMGIVLFVLGLAGVFGPI